MITWRATTDDVIKHFENLWVQGGEEPPVHGEHLCGVLHRVSGKVGHLADVQVVVGADQVADSSQNGISFVEINVESHGPT